MRTLLAATLSLVAGCADGTSEETTSPDTGVGSPPGLTDPTDSWPMDTGDEVLPPPSPVGTWQLESATARSGTMALSAEGGEGDLTVADSLDASLEIALDVDAFLIDVHLGGSSIRESEGEVDFLVTGSFCATGSLGRLCGGLAGDIVCELTTEGADDVMVCDGVLDGEMTHLRRQMPISVQLAPRFVRVP